MQIINAGDFESVPAAIDFLSKKPGPRELIIPKGLTKTGPISLVSDLTIRLEEGAVLQFMDDPDLYPPI